MGSQLSGEQKAAILLHSLGEDIAAEIMKHLEPQEIRRIGMRLSEAAAISRDDKNHVLQEFQTGVKTGAMEFGGKEFVESVLKKALGAEKAQRIMNSLSNTTYPGLEQLKWIDPRSLANFLKTEHPQMIAVILAYIDQEQGAQVLKLLPDHLRGDVALRLSTLEDVSPAALQQLSDVLQESLGNRAQSTAERLGGPKAVANLLNSVEKSLEESVLKSVAERNGPIAEQIRALMFTFTDLIQLDDRAMQEILKEVDKGDLALALKGVPQDLKNKFTKNMSQRAAEMMLEDMEARGPVKQAEVEKAQTAIIKICRKLETEGKIVIPGKGSAAVV